MIYPRAFLSDGTIRRLLAEGNLGITPLEPKNIQPASVDVRLHSDLLIGMFSNNGEVDPRNPGGGVAWHRVKIPASGWLIGPGEFVLGSTMEYLTLPNDIIARVEGKSSLGRLGLLIHATAGFIDPGWTNGQITLELNNTAPLPFRLYAGMKIGQLSFAYLDLPAERPYGSVELGSHYQGQSGPEASRYEL